MSALALKVSALATTLVVFVGSFAYASANVKNAQAPLQPPLVDRPDNGATASPTPLPALVGTRRGSPPRPSSSPAPRLTLQPGVHTTALPEVTFTHVS